MAAVFTGLDLPIRQGLAGFDRQLPVVQHTFSRERGFEVVFFPHRDTAAGDDEVEIFSRFAQRGAGGLQAVRHQTEVFAAPAQGMHAGDEGGAVAVVNGTGPQRLAWHHQFISGGEHTHTRLAIYGYRGGANRRHHAQRLRRQTCALRKHHLPHRHVFTTPSNGIANRRHGQEPHRAIQAFGLFLHQHCIRPWRNGRTSEDAGSGARLQRLAHTARGNALAHGQHRAHFFDVGHAQGITIHSAVVVGRDVEGGDNVSGQDTAQGGGDGHSFRAKSV